MRETPDQYESAKRVSDLSDPYIRVLRELRGYVRAGDRAQVAALAQAPSSRLMVRQLQSAHMLFDQNEETVRHANRG